MERAIDRPPADPTVFQGGVNTVLRRGDTVHRPATAATPTIHRLLTHLRAAGFDGAPVPVPVVAEPAAGESAAGESVAGESATEQSVAGEPVGDHEVLSYLPGDVHGALPDALRTPQLLASAAVLLRRLHDASESFPVGPTDRWQLPAREPVEVICHGDVAPYNAVVRDGAVVGLIDFDTAHPGPRLWDVAYAVYRFAPLHAPTNPDAAGDPVRQARLAASFCLSYGLWPGAALLDTVTDRITALVEHITERAAAGDRAFAAHVAAGHLTLYREDLRYLAEQRPALLTVFAAACRDGRVDNI